MVALSRTISEHLSPFIANLGACCANDEDTCRRLATLDVLNMFTKKVGHLYNWYVREAMPFLVELMEGNSIIQVKWSNVFFKFLSIFLSWELKIGHYSSLLEQLN